MALFKISKGLSTNLMTNVPNAKEGFAYFTTDDGKFYIDIDGDGSNNTPAVIGNNRIPLNAYTSDILKATSMGTNDNVVYPLLTFKVKDSTKNLIEAKYGAIGIKNGTLVIPNVNNNDEILISNTGAGRGIVIDNTNGTGHAIEITAGKGIKVAKDPVDNLELATKQYVDKILSANDAMIFKGILDDTHKLPDTHETGWTYRVNKAGTYAGKACEIGDLVICTTDGLSANDAHWTVAQTNIDGAVIGPNTSTANAVPTFADETGKVIKDNPAVTIDDTGLFTAPYIATGLDGSHYFQSAKFRGEGDANTYYHAIDFGYAGHDRVDFHEYGGTWNFYKNTKGTVNGGQLVVSIKPDGFHGNLKGNADTATTATSATTATKITQTVRDAEEGNYPLLLANNGQTATTTGATYFDKSVTLNPKTNTITANISGKANTSGTADEVANNLTIQLNNGTTEGTNKFTYNGSAVKNINITSSSIGAASSSHNHDSSYVKKSGDTMTGDLTAPTFHGELDGNADTASCLNKRTGNWFNASLGLNWYKYEGADTSTYQLPLSNICIQTLMEGPNRGFAIAGDWTNSRSGMWMNNLHDDSGSYKWGGWKRIWVEGNSVTGAVWNDYAECRESDCEEFGYVLTETGDDTLTKTTERLQHFAGVSSDTWGFSQGETAHARTPIAVAGRVLVYTYQDRNNYKPGDCVCAAPGGTVDIMTREEVREWPDRIVGTVSCVPNYEEWGGGEGADRGPIKVDGRIWIKVK